MRLINADRLKEKLLKMKDDIANKSDAWKPAYLLILDEYIKMIDEMPSATQHCDCNHDCDATKEAAIAVTKLENSKVTKKEIWDKVIQDLKTLDQEAHGEEFVPLITATLVMTAEQLSTDVIHGTIIMQKDRYHMWSLIDKLGNYSIKGETIWYLPEYQELITLMRKVL